MNKYPSLTSDVRAILKDKATEPAFGGCYLEPAKKGSYLCRGCGFAVFRADQQFHSGCGWPSFDGEVAAKVERVPDADGRRTEIVCQHCQGHLGHVFEGERLTEKNIRHCVNSLALEYVENSTINYAADAIFAAGCFWGVEHQLSMVEGVLKVESGYTGGEFDNPGYDQVCQGGTGHIEAVRVVYDPSICSYQSLLKVFFEIHNPEQQNGQGVDIGSQYLSAIFYFDDQQKKDALSIMQILEGQGLHLSTQLRTVETFWPAEDYHQSYYKKHSDLSVCHIRTKRF